jgi:hypothetical protein
VTDTKPLDVLRDAAAVGKALAGQKLAEPAFPK